jgi:hypothetical protein
VTAIEFNNLPIWVQRALLQAGVPIGDISEVRWQGDGERTRKVEVRMRPIIDRVEVTIVREGG